MPLLTKQNLRRLYSCASVWLLGAVAWPAIAQPSEDIVAYLQSSPHTVAMDESSSAVIDHEIGLGTIKKVRGVWRFKDSERLSGQLLRRTWQVADGFTSLELLEALEEQLAEDDRVQLIFGCDGRACGHSAQWANRVFGQRLLYGREGQQRYRVYQLQEGGQSRAAIYAASRSTDRQYLHVEILLGEEDPP